MRFDVSPPRAVSTALATTARVAIHTAEANPLSIAQHLHIANTDSSIRTVTIERYDAAAATRYSLASGMSIAANSFLGLDLSFQMANGDKVECTAGTVNTLTVTLTVTEINRTA